MRRRSYESSQGRSDRRAQQCGIQQHRRSCCTFSAAAWWFVCRRYANAQEDGRTGSLYNARCVANHARAKEKLITLRLKGKAPSVPSARQPSSAPPPAPRGPAPSRVVPPPVAPRGGPPAAPAPPRERLSKPLNTSADIVSRDSSAS